jgi:hypothetical protein
VLSLGCLVNARRSLYQSKPSIEASKATTAGGGRKHLSASPWPNQARHVGTSIQPLIRSPPVLRRPTSVTGRGHCQLRA